MRRVLARCGVTRTPERSLQLFAASSRRQLPARNTSRPEGAGAESVPDAVETSQAGDTLDGGAVSSIGHTHSVPECAASAQDAGVGPDPANEAAECDELAEERCIHRVSIGRFDGRAYSAKGPPPGDLTIPSICPPAVCHSLTYKETGRW